MGKGVEQRRRHLGVAEHGRPFAEAVVGRDDDACALVELAQQVEQERPAGGAERQVANLVEDEEILIRSGRLIARVLASGYDLGFDFGGQSERA